MLKVAEGQFAQGAVDGRAEAQACEVRLGDASPQAAFAVEGHHMVVVVHGFQIHQQRGMAVDTQGGSGQQRSLQAVSLALTECALRRPRRVCILVRQRINEFLDLRRRLERAQGAQILRRQAETLVPVSPKSVSRQFLTL